MRRVGLELELGGLEVARVAAVVVASCGGSPVTVSETVVDVKGTRWGDFRVELDSLPLQERRYLEPLQWLGIDIEESEAARVLEQSVLGVAKLLVPVEVVAPPIPIDRLGELEPLWAALRAAGAEGSDASPLYAFGLQLNPELARLEAGVVSRHLQAYFLLEPWLVAGSGPDLSRRILPFVHPFPRAYAREVVASDPDVSWEALIEHYVRVNPTRNRPLDLLPLFRHCSELGLADDGWLSKIEDDPDLVKARPTFHYRLPDCRIGDPSWSPAVPWNDWVEVERLADDERRLETMRAEYLGAGDRGWFDLVRRLVSSTEDGA